VSFATRKRVEATEKSEVSHVTLDGKDGNTWEQLLAAACERDAAVAAYVKNDHLGFSIPYVHAGRAYSYVPDFLLRLQRADGEDFDRTLIVEVSGGQKSPGPTKEKATTARDRWCVAVNNHGGFGRWGYIEITSMEGVRERLADAIAALYDDAPIIGDPDLLDIDKLWRGERAAS
jgi:type III restriction enzyme